MNLSTEIVHLIGNFALGFVATVTAAGKPAVSPKGTFLILDESTIAFSDIRSPGTISNLQRDPAVEVNFIDPFKRKGARVRGTAKVLGKDEGEFTALFPHWQKKWPDLANRVRHLVVIDVEAASIITTPPYDDGATESEMVALYKKTFAGIYP